MSFSGGRTMSPLPKANRRTRPGRSFRTWRRPDHFARPRSRHICAQLVRTARNLAPSKGYSATKGRQPAKAETAPPSRATGATRPPRNSAGQPDGEPRPARTRGATAPMNFLPSADVLFRRPSGHLTHSLAAPPWLTDVLNLCVLAERNRLLVTRNRARKHRTQSEKTRGQACCLATTSRGNILCRARIATP